MWVNEIKKRINEKKEIFLCEHEKKKERQMIIIDRQNSDQ